MLPILALVACLQQNEPEASKDAEPTELAASNLDAPESGPARIERLSDRLDWAIETCEHGPKRMDSDGSRAMAEVDVAMADNIDSVSPDQEHRIRASIGAEMGLAPSEVNGWRDIYRGRAEQARRLLERHKEEDEETRKSACDAIAGLKQELLKARAPEAASEG